MTSTLFCNRTTYAKSHKPPPKPSYHYMTTILNLYQQMYKSLPSNKSLINPNQKAMQPIKLIRTINGTVTANNVPAGASLLRPQNQAGLQVVSVLIL